MIEVIMSMSGHLSNIDEIDEIMAEEKEIKAHTKTTPEFAVKNLLKMCLIFVDS